MKCQGAYHASQTVWGALAGSKNLGKPAHCPDTPFVSLENRSPGTDPLWALQLVRSLLCSLQPRVGTMQWGGNDAVT